ncbi:MAG: acetamidase/formamidase family protein [Rhizobiaceae bacterium]
MIRGHSSHALGCNHTIHAHQTNLCWDCSIEPAIRVAPGETVEFQGIDATSGQLTRDSTLSDLEKLDFSLINPVSGPVYVEGAEPGDALKVTLLDFAPSGWAWTAIVPNFGLLQGDFKQAALRMWDYDTSFSQPAAYGSFAKVPLKPFCGTVGVAPAEGRLPTLPPHAAGGNMDIRDLTAGVELFLPVQVPGALFSIGDPHAGQGDGEVCGCAIESPMGVAVKLEVVKDARLRFPRFRTPGPVTRHLDAKGYDATTGIGPDLMEAARDAVRGMIDLLGREHHLSPEDAYMLCSVCADMRISEIVDQPNWVVSCYLPRIVFD